jgi:opacity protein-like surface antigen
MKLKHFVIINLIVCFFGQSMQAQQPSTKVRPKFEAYRDSLKNVKYDHVFPIWGQKAYAKGFDIPYPLGGMANFVWMEQNITISNLQLGLETSNNNIGLTPIDFIKFGDNTNTSYSVNVRPDVWVFPFLNVYGLLGVGQTTTEVNLVYPINLTSTVKQKISTYGIGIMAAGAVGPVFFSLDANFTWNKPELLDEAVPVRVVGVRAGHSFVFKDKPERNIAVWAGAMFVEMGGATYGQISLSEALPSADGSKRDEIVNNYYDWYDNEATIPEKAVADRVLTPIIERLEAADGNAIIKYGLDKQVQQKWNGLIGAQFQYNKHWQVRTEAGILGNRKSVLVSLNYRFLL